MQYTTTILADQIQQWFADGEELQEQQWRGAETYHIEAVADSDEAEPEHPDDGFKLALTATSAFYQCWHGLDGENREEASEGCHRLQPPR